MSLQDKVTAVGNAIIGLVNKRAKKDLSNLSVSTFPGGCSGNAATATSATKATQDASGNVITTTYAKKSEVITTSSLVECKVVIQTYINGTSGYRIWSDGYCEQWGYMAQSNSTSQVNSLLKTMRDTNYHINITAVVDSWSGGLNSVFDLTVNSFKLWTSDDSTFNSCPIKWQVCGYLAAGEY